MSLWKPKLYPRKHERCQNVSLDQFTKMTNKTQLCRIIYCSLTAVHVSSDIFAHHQEHLNCMYSFWYYSPVSLPAGIEAIQPAYWRYQDGTS
jgi:hypothetical protein